MKKSFNQIMNVSLLSSFIFIIFGIFLFCKPDLANKTIGIFLGIIILLMSISSLIKYIFNKKTYKIFRWEFVFALLAFLLGIFIIFNPLSVTAFLTIGLGIWFLISGLLKLQNALVLRKFKENYFLLAIVISLVNILFGIILIFDPFKSTLKITEIIGLFIVAYGFLSMVEISLFKRNVKTITKIVMKRDENGQN